MILFNPDHLRARRARTAAFNLVEAAVAMGVIGLAIFALYTALLTGMEVVQRSRENLRATQVMTELMDILRLYNWEQVTDPTFSPKQFNVDYDPIAATNGGSGVFTYNCVMTVSPGPTNLAYSDYMKTVTLNIDWQNGDHPGRTRAFVSYVTKNGLQSYIYY
jgi:hypothetical protein